MVSRRNTANERACVLNSKFSPSLKFRRLRRDHLTVVIMVIEQEHDFNSNVVNIVTEQEGDFGSSKIVRSEDERRVECTRVENIK